MALKDPRPPNILAKIQKYLTSVPLKSVKSIQYLPVWSSISQVTFIKCFTCNLNFHLFCALSNFYNPSLHFNLNYTLSLWFLHIHILSEQMIEKGFLSLSFTNSTISSHLQYPVSLLTGLIIHFSLLPSPPALTHPPLLTERWWKRGSLVLDSVKLKDLQLSNETESFLHNA